MVFWKKKKSNVPVHPAKFRPSVDCQVGVPVSVLHIDSFGQTSHGTQEVITWAMIEQMKTIVALWNAKRTNPAITRIECIINDILYDEFKDARDQLQEQGRWDGRERVLFHGTPPENVYRYLWH
jgi:hypothetical protein